MAFTKVAPAGIGSTPGDGYRIGDSFLHSTGVEITNINATGILTAASLDISGAIDFDGHTELDNVNISGVSTFTGNIDANGDLDVDGHTNLDNVSVSGVSTFSGIVAAGVGSTAVSLANGKMLTFGSEHELEMFHDGSQSYIKQRYHAYPSALNIISENSAINIMSGNGSNAHGGYENAIKCLHNGAVELYHSGTLHFETYGGGIKVQGNIQVGQDIAHHYDTDTKISFPAADTISFDTNGSERLRIDSSGRVMIRTTTAGASSSDLTIGGTTGAGRIMIRSANNAGGYIGFQDTTGATVDGQIEYNHILNSFNFYFGSQERFRIHTQGMIGLSGSNYGTSGQVLTSAGTGSPVSWTTITGTTINNNASDRIITGSGTANTLEGQSTVTFDGTQFRVNAGNTSSLQVDGLYCYAQIGGVKLWRGAGNRSHNTGLGAGTLGNASGGQDCTAVGHNALQNSTSGSANTAVGSHSMVGTVTGSNNVSVGHGSLNKLTSGYANSVVGRTAGLEMLGGYNNTLMGYEAGYNITSGNSNTAFGYLALKTLTGNAGCVAVGSNALQACTGADNCAVGFAAGQQVSTGTNNVLLGSSAGLSIQAGHHNIAIGRDALRLGSNSNVSNNVVLGSSSVNQLTNAYNNVVLGYNCAGSATMTGGTTWHSNVVIGYQAGNNVPSAASNIVIGKYTCGNAGHSQSDNIIMGVSAGQYLGNSSNNLIVMGQEAAQYAGNGSGSNLAYSWVHSIAIGYRAFRNATGAPDAVVAVGPNALREHNGDGDGSSGGYICAMGQSALATCEHMRHSVAIGNDAGAYWNPAKGNQHEGGAVFVGGGAGRYQGTATALVAIGRDALNSSSSSPASGSNNTAIGARCLEKLTSGSHNVCVSALYGALFVDTGSWNTFMGSLAGYGYDTNNSCRSGNYCTQIGAYTKSSGASNDYENCFGYGITGKGANTTHIRGSAYNSNNSSSWSTTSDERIKKNIVDNNIGLDAIEKIRVRNFEYRTKNEITDFDNADSVVVKKEGVQLGVIAQEIKDILPDVVKQNTTGAYAVDPDNLTWYLVNAVKELSAEVKSLKAQLNS